MDQRGYAVCFHFVVEECWARGMVMSTVSQQTMEVTYASMHDARLRLPTRAVLLDGFRLRVGDRGRIAHVEINLAQRLPADCVRVRPFRQAIGGGYMIQFFPQRLAGKWGQTWANVGQCMRGYRFRGSK